MRKKTKSLLFILVAISLLLGCCEQQGNKRKIKPVARHASLLLFSNPLEGAIGSQSMLLGIGGLALLAVLWREDRKLNESLVSSVMSMHDVVLEQNKLQARQLKYMETISKDRHNQAMRALSEIKEQLNKA